VTALDVRKLVEAFLHVDPPEALSRAALEVLAVARAKSDRVDAELLANILRTDRNAHRPLPSDSELAQAIGVLARAQQDAVWNRQHIANQLRSLLREYYPAWFCDVVMG
jgi:transposase